MKKINVQLTFTEELLGTNPNSEKIYTEYIGSKAPDAVSIEDEVAAIGVAEVADKGLTVFKRTQDGKPFMNDYQIKGYFKDACAALMRVCGRDKEAKKKNKVNESGLITNYKKTIDQVIFVTPREIILNLSGDIGNCQRSLRANTPLGERTALANSETAPKGTTMEFTVVCIADDMEKAVREWLDYGEWRNSGKGRFTWQEVS